MKPQQLYDLLIKNKIEFFAGVPDSLLKDFCAYVTDSTDNYHHTITANEGNAIALATGHYLATGNPALVYMQNSGIGNCVNPLLSLTDEEVYNIPLLLLIGWRGEPGKKDEPQHIKQGKVTNKLLEVMGIKYEIIPKNFEEACPIIENTIQYIKEERKAAALIARKDLFEKYELRNKKQSGYKLKREDAIEIVIKNLNFNDVIVSTTGHISREVYETRERLGQSHKQDFLTVGSMGHASSIALGIALEKPDRNIYCFDGDGAFLMHEGAVIVNASKNLTNFKHIVFNNEAHDSVGAQPTVADNAELSKIALSSGYAKSYSVDSKKDLEKILPEFINDRCATFLEIKVKCGARDDLGRPKEKPQENKQIFMANLNQVDFCYRDAIKNLSKITALENAKRVLVFTGKKSYKNIKNAVEQELQELEIQYYNDFSINPKDEEVKIAAERINDKFDLIIAVGGGSVIDFAKSYRWQIKSCKKLIAIPTTAGTGSEATQFAVLYINGVKTSLDNSEILPNYAIVDSQFVENNPKYLKACTAMDAYCHAIESYWAIKSTPVSREFAKQAILLCREYIVPYVNTSDVLAAEKMALASNLAGKAINISRTTVSHAVSYPMTYDYNIPHGHAVASTIGQLMALNLRKEENALNDYRGKKFVDDRLRELQELISYDPIKYFRSLFRKIDLEYDFERLGIENYNDIIYKINIERLSNNPYELNEKDFFKLFYKI